MIEVLGVPFDQGGHRQGSRLGSSAVRKAGLITTLESLGQKVEDKGDLSQGEDFGDSCSDSWCSAICCLKAVKERVRQSLSRKAFPLVIGGDHSVSIGTIPAALEALRSDLAVLWIDAHADLNTPGTSPSGNLHGMPLGALIGLPSGVEGRADEAWKTILKEIVPAKRLKGNRIAWIGLRDVDPGEKERFTEIRGEFTATMYDIDRHGLVTMLQRFDEWMRTTGVRNLWISFDVDALDPILAPGTGTAVRGGLTYREMHLMGELLHELLSAKDCPYRLAGLDLMEINPLYDTNNETARTAVEWIASLFGKTILGKR